jgi:hypothetical protein
MISEVCVQHVISSVLILAFLSFILYIHYKMKLCTKYGYVY